MIIEAHNATIEFTNDWTSDAPSIGFPPTGGFVAVELKVTATFTYVNTELINVLRMADHLWNRYRKVGLGVALARFHSSNNRASDQREALMHTTLATYKQFCRRHGIATGLSDAS